ncbi:MAG: DUF2298 domain-containing protein, partial [Chloroflexales bacterium]|nr:DUF2298 domain-containing protein [Chloroflexales bacterium]
MDIRPSSTHSSESISQARAASRSEAIDALAQSTRPWWRTAWATRLVLILILLVGAYFRTLSLHTWDGGTGQHPDERFFRDITSTVSLPASLGEYFESARSPANPRNYPNGGFFVYGPFPVMLTRFAAVTLTPNEALPEEMPSILGPPIPQTNTGPLIPNPERAIPKLTLLHPLFNPDGRNLTTYGEIVKVGRSLAVLFDLGSIVLVFLIAQRLFDRRVGLLAALLSALAVMQIQQSHFFVDPIFSTFFVLFVLYWAVRTAQGGGIGSYTLLGVSVGMAMSTRITLATLGLIAIVAAVLAALNAWRRVNGDQRQNEAESTSAGQQSPIVFFFTRSFPLLCLAGAVTLLTYRSLQPDAFIGSTPTSPVIPGEQAMPLDVMAGWGFFDIRLDPRFLNNMDYIRRLVSSEADAPPSQQWVSRTDYLFPWRNMVLWGMGPALGLTAWFGWAYFGLRTLSLGLIARRRVADIAHPALLLWLWIGFYFAWQGAQFAITMRYLLPIYGALIIFAAWLSVRFWDWGKKQRAVARRRQSVERLRLKTFAYLSPFLALGLVLATLAWAYAFTRIYTEPHSRIKAAQWLQEHAPPGSYITNEKWDDALPVYVDGHHSWGVIYEGIQTSPYDEDDPGKYFGSFNVEGQYQPGLLDQLEQADYITLTSNRVYDSATRLPMRYPALMRYYHYLFTGELGFELVAEITSYPKLFGIPIPDQVAEEAFSVYDHPRVLIFEKTAAFSRERAEELITGDVNWSEVYKSPVGVADRAPTALRLTESVWPTYSAGGTWSALFNPQGLATRFAPLTWLVVLYSIALATFALLFRLLSWLPDRGWALARPIGVLIVAYLAWLLGSIQFMPFTPATVWLCALPLLAGGAWVAWRSRADLLDFWRERRAALLTAEAIFLGFFVLGLALRWFNPDLWHPTRGGEKPMNFAYLNAVLKSAAFPPYDPWHAGGYINYYYFGFVIVGALIHLTGVVPSIAYNLAAPTLFALTAVGAWGVVYNLIAPKRLVAREQCLEAEEAKLIYRKPALFAERRARISALLAPIFVLLLGNLAQAIWYITGYAAQQMEQGRAEWAFWDATRIVPGAINEFPFFTFLFADLHAHMIVMPFALAMLGLTVALARRTMGNQAAVPGAVQEPVFNWTSLRVWLTAHWPLIGVLLLLGLLAGTLRATNTWDYPSYVGLTVATLGLISFRHMALAQWRYSAGAAASPWLIVGRGVLIFIAQTLIIIVAGNLFFLPFISQFATESSGVELLRDGSRNSLLGQLLFAERSSVGDLLLINGLWLFILTSAGLVLIRRCLGRQSNWALPAGLAVILLLFVLVGLALGLAAPVLLIPLALGSAWLVWRLRFLPTRMLLPLLWGGAALALALLVELVVVKGDVGRMNTVFKFGLHAWTLFGLAAAVALPWMWRQLGVGLQVWKSAARQRIGSSLVWMWRGAAMLLVAASLVYPLTATPARISDRYAENLPRTLDGAAFMQYASGSEAGYTFPLSEDAEAIAWLQQNAEGTPIVLEAHQPSYHWAGRIATFTGLPTVLGWEWHQIQQRNVAGATPVINQRQEVVASIYNSSDLNEALQQIEAYGVEYVYVGGVERAIYDPAGLAKFETMVQRGYLAAAFRSGETTIYRVIQPGAPTMLTTDLPVVPPQLRTPPRLMLDQPVNALPAVGDYAWNSWASSNSWVALVTWLVILYALALLGLPLAVLMFGRWRDGGFTWARLIGLLVLGYVVWLPASLGIWQYDRWGLLAGVILVLVLNAAILVWIGRATHDDRVTSAAGVEASDDARRSALARGLRIVVARLRARRRAVLLGEGLFLGGFALFTLFRAFNPDLWQPIWGGEKPMEFGFLNAILRSPVMPPYDPFFSGGYINYYYYGMYLVSLPIRATGIAPALAYNLVIPTLFGLTLAGGYAIVAQLTGRVRYGLLGAAFLALLGNLASYFAAGWSNGFSPVLEALRNGDLATIGERLDAWFIGPSRVIPNTINEFPFWSFLFADLHPHLIALPIALLVIALAYQILDIAWGQSTSVFTYALTALTLGALAVTNSWDFPTYALLIAAALVGVAWRSAATNVGARALHLGRAILLTLAIAIGGLALYMPFFDHFYAFVSGIGRVEDFTSTTDYLILYGVFVAVLVPVVFGALWRVIAHRIRNKEQRVKILVPSSLSVVVLPIGIMIFSPSVGLRAWLFLLLVACAVLLLQRSLARSTWFAVLLVGLGWAVSLGVETVFIRDHLAGGDWYRMNTVFKFGIQIWTLLALAAAAGLPLLLRGLYRLGGVAAQGVGLALLAVPVVIAAIFPLVGPPSRLAYRFPESPPGLTLDGLAFLRQASFTYDCQSSSSCEPGVDRVTVDLSGDADAIAWLNDNISGTPIVVQSNLWFYRAYGVRIAANTGLPTVISALHTDEQRDPFVTSIRNYELEEFYRTTDLETTLRFLAKHRVDYIYVGGVERAFYNEAGLRKFEDMRDTYLNTVYDAPQVQIYKVRAIPDSYALPEPFDFAAEASFEPSRPLPEQSTDIPAGLEELEQASSTNPTDAALAFGLAEQYRSLGRLDDAAQVLNRASPSNPNDIGLHHLWGDILSDAGRTAEAEQAYTQAARTEPTAGNWTKLGAALLEWGELDKAELALNQAITIDSTVSEPHYRLGQLY